MSETPQRRIILYYVPPSPPCRCVMMLAKAVGVELDLVLINLKNGEHMTEEYLKINPQHVVPTIDDNGFILWESRAIMAYLVNAYGKDDSLYPKDPKRRALVDQRMFFDIGTLFPRYIELYLPVLWYKAALDPILKAKLNEALGFLEKFLEESIFFAGDHLTIADFSLIVVISNLDMFEYDLKDFPNILEWYEGTKRALEPFGYEDINIEGAKTLPMYLMNG